MCQQTDQIDLPMVSASRGPSPAPLGAARAADAGTSERPERMHAVTRRKLWDIPHKYHCPVIGTCLHVEELREIARKAGAKPRQSLTDYDVHVSFVAAADEKNRLTVAVQKTLDRKYAGAVRRFAQAKSADAVRELWAQSLANGQVPEAFWALMTHPRADVEVQSEAYEDVHMLSHQIGAGLSADIQALAEARKALAELRRESAAENDRAARRAAAKDTRLMELEQRSRRLEETDRALEEAVARIRELESGDALRALWARITSLEGDLIEEQRQRKAAVARAAGLRRRLDAAQARNDALAAQVAERDATCAALEQLLGGPGLEGDICSGDCKDCPGEGAGTVDLGGRRILCVGGRGSLAAHYRDLVQRCNGELIRHDGGQEESRQRLEALLASADAVVCPADCVSHDAYLRAKRFCKRVAKPCLLIERSGISAFAKALSDLAAQCAPAGATATKPALSPNCH